MQRGVYINVGKFYLSFLMNLQLISIEVSPLLSDLLDLPQPRSVSMVLVLFVNIIPLLDELF